VCVIRFGGDEAEYLTLTIHGRSLPDSAAYWDGNWLTCTAEVAAGAFSGSLDRLVRNDDISRFYNRIAELNERLTGEAQFDTLDGWLDVRVLGEGRGHMEVRGELWDDPAHGNVLEFRLFLDHTALPHLMAQLRAVLEAFPIRGKPDA
jgi:hypothetical protein